MVNFMKDPTGDIPWEEDATATDVVHIDTKQVRLGGGGVVEGGHSYRFNENRYFCE